MNNGKLFDHRVKCPGMLTSKLTGLFGWRHTYRVHDRQKGINHYHNSQNLHKTYSLNLPPKRFHETTSSNPSLPEASSSSSSVNTVMSGLNLFSVCSFAPSKNMLTLNFLRFTLKPIRFDAYHVMTIF
jgi:hypothetical protein